MQHQSTTHTRQTARGITSQAIRRPIGTLALAAVVIVIGFFYLDRLSIDLLPQINYPQVTVTVNYPGASPEVMEEQVTRVLETNLSSTENLISIESRASEGRTNVNLIFEYGTNIDTALQDASRNLELARTQLPTGIIPPRIYKHDPASDPIYQAGVTSTIRSEIEVRDWLENRLVPQLLSIRGVGGVEVAGGQVREMQVVIDQERLHHYGLSLEAVLNTIRDENIDIAAGQVTSASFDVMAKTDGRYQTLDDLRRVELSIPGSRQQIPLGEIADILDTHQEQRIFVRLNGQPATQVSVMKLPDANTVDVVDRVAAEVERLQQSGFIPEDMLIQATRDPSFFIRASISAVSTAAILGGVLAMLVVLLFLGSLRKSFIIGLSIPIAIMATFSMMGAGNLTLNIMSLGGLALGVGLLLDNSIVMLENIFRHRDKLGKSALDAADDGAREVTSAVIASTMTNLAAVLPFLLITGLVSLIFRELILTISFAIIASLAAALTLVPMLAALLVRVRFISGLSESGFYRSFNRALGRLTIGYRHAASAALRWRYAVVGLALLALSGAAWLAQSLGNGFLPQVDDGGFNVSMSFPPGAPPDVTNAASMLIENTIAGMPHVESIFSIAGGHLGGGILNERPGTARFAVQLDPAHQRAEWPAQRWVSEMQQRLEDLDIAGARIFVRAPRIQGIRTNLAGADVSIGLVGDDIATLDQIGRDLVLHLGDIEGLDNFDLGRDDRTPLLNIDVDRERAASLGLQTGEIGQAVRTAVLGSVPTRFSTSSAEYDIRVMLPRDQVQNRDDLGDIVLFRRDGLPVRLQDVASFDLTDGPAHIERENQVRIVRINGDVNQAISDVGRINDEIRQRMRDYPLPEGYSLIYGGEEEVIRETNRNLYTVIGLAIFLVFVVLAVQYERVANPLVILSAVPLALTGVGGMLWLTGTLLSAPVMLGVILLVGIVVNNAILLVEYIELGRREQNLTVVDAVLRAGEIRLRPILMTTLTTVCGMLPLAIGLGEGAELMRPLAIAVVGGLLTSMLLTLFVVPCLYVIINALAERMKQLLTGRAGQATGDARMA
jgi:hydrophobe/amphiphile efflux-1 (HAE1) family protein